MNKPTYCIFQSDDNNREMILGFRSYEERQNFKDRMEASFKLQEVMTKRVDEILNMFPETSTWNKTEFLEELQSLKEQSTL